MEMKSKDIAVVVLAAGMGTRMKSPLPKVLHLVAGKPMISHALDSALALDPTKLFVVLSPEMTHVQETVKAHYSSAAFAFQEERLGTAHAVQQACPQLEGFEGTVLVLYADTPLIRTDTLKAMVVTLRELDNPGVVVLGFVPEDPAEYGRLIVDEDNMLEAIVEYKDADEAQRGISLCNSGVMAIDGQHLLELIHSVKNDNAKKEYYLTDIVALARGKTLQCSVVEGEEREVMGINSQAERAKAETLVQEDLRKAALDNGVMMIAPETVFLNQDTELASGVIIHPHVVFGPNVKVEANVEIKSFSHIEGATIRDGATVGPFARLRPGADIGKDAKIGNFVEIKKSELGEGAKVSHLSYIGDASVGKDANIGAGTVTCNYDGYQKARTEIGDGAFIGSNSSLVAPVTVGEGAIVGAGSTILDDVEKDALAVNDMPQKNTAGKAASYRKNAAKS